MSRFHQVVVRAESLVDDEQIGQMKDALRQYNQSSNPAWWAAREEDQHRPRPLSVIAQDDQSEMLGALTASTSMTWLKIELMAVLEHCRQQGIGRRIMQAAETEAMQRGCQRAYVDTMDYQSPDFYVKCGYTIVGRLANWDAHGHDKLFLTKELVSSEVPAEDS